MCRIYVYMYIYIYLYYICLIISCLKGFALFYHIPHIWNAYVMQKNYHNPPNMQSIITYFQGRFKFMKLHILVIFPK